MRLRSVRTALESGAALLACVGASWAASDAHSFSIPQEEAEISIPVFAQQAGRQIVAPGQALKGITTPAISGTLETAAALALLLKDTPLSVASDDGRTVILVVRPKARPTPAPIAPEPTFLAAPEAITVTGYRASLQSAAMVKRSAANFSDSVFAVDIGKFPDLNAADAINRVPGIQLTRDQDGEGTQISVRGLGPSFTEVLMNGHPVDVATDGTLGSGNQNREVDLDMFPVELFTRITVNKTPTADMYEGGIAGVVDMATVRPLDEIEAGFHLNYSFQEQLNSNSGALSPRAALIASQSWSERFGILIGLAVQHYQFRDDGYESVGNALADVGGQQPAGSCPNCNTIGSGQSFRWASVVPAAVAANPSLGIGAAGSPYAYSGGVNTPGGTSGLSTTDLSNVIFPYLASPVLKIGSKNRYSLLGDIQYRPSEELEFNLSTLYEYAQRDYDDEQMDWFVRNSCNAAGTDPSCMIPVNLKTDNLHYLTAGTFLNTSFFFISQPFRENIHFLDVSPTVDWSPRPWLKVHGALDYNDSAMNRRQWSYLAQTTPGAGYTATYRMTPGQDMPTITTTAPLNDPASGTWQWYSVRAQPLFRDTIDKGTQWTVSLGDETASLKFGYDYQQHYRFINARDNSTMAQRCVLGTSTADALCTLADGTTLPAGAAGLVTNAQLGQYLSRIPASNFLHSSDGSEGFNSFVIATGALDKATNIRGFLDSAPFNPTGSLGAQKSGAVDEKTQNGFIEADALIRLLDHDIHLNAGLRYYNTLQKIVGPISQGSGFVNFSDSHTYQGVLPSFNMAIDASEDIVVRLAASRSMTRSPPAALLPGMAFNSALLSPISAGNPDLQPYFSDNMDVGAEWYLGGPGQIAIDYFRKNITNFTTTQTMVEPFSATGIPVASLTPTQLADYNANGGPNESVSVTTTINLTQTLYLDGLEVSYVLPLDFLLEGIGINGTVTHVSKHVDAGVTTSQAQDLVTGIAPNTFNAGAYYEHGDISVHMTYNYISKFISTATPASQNILQPEYTAAYGQLDLSASYAPAWLNNTAFHGAQFTLDVLNLNQARSRIYIGNTDNPDSVYYPGTSVLLGFKGRI